MDGYQGYTTRVVVFPFFFYSCFVVYSSLLVFLRDNCFGIFVAEIYSYSFDCDRKLLFAVRGRWGRDSGFFQAGRNCFSRIIGLFLNVESICNIVIVVEH